MPKNRVTQECYRYSIEEDDREFVWSVYLVIDGKTEAIEDGFSDSREEAFSDAKAFATEHLKSQSSDHS